MTKRQALSAIIFALWKTIFAETSISAMVASMEHDRRKDLDALIRIAGSQRKLAVSLETTEETVSRWMSGSRGVPAYVSVLVELLDALPRKDWPERWR